MAGRLHRRKATESLPVPQGRDAAARSSAASRAAQKGAETRKRSLVMGQEDFPTPAKCLIGELAHDLKATPAGALLVREAQAHRTRILLSDGHDHMGGYDHEHNRIILRVPVRKDGTLRARLSPENRAQLRLTLTHELRHLWQGQHGRLMDELGYTPADTLLVNRIIEADAEAVTVHLAWERKVRGWPQCWQGNHGWYRDMYAAYESAAEHIPQAVENGAALQAAFKQWFRNRQRVRQADHLRLIWWAVDAGRHPIRANRDKAPLDYTELHVLGDVGLACNYLSGRAGQILDLSVPAYSGGITRKNQKYIADLNVRYGHHQAQLPFAEERDAVDLDISKLPPKYPEPDFC